MTKEGGPMSTNNKPNRLIAEKSPYLLQHAHNPVDWYPWGEEAFEKAHAKTSRFWSASVIRLVIGAMTLKITNKQFMLNHFILILHIIAN